MTVYYTPGQTIVHFGSPEGTEYTRPKPKPVLIKPGGGSFE